MKIVERITVIVYPICPSIFIPAYLIVLVFNSRKIKYVHLVVRDFARQGIVRKKQTLT